MKLIYLPLLAVYNIGFLQNVFSGLTPVYVSVKTLYFRQDLEENNANPKS